jgi:hypothetical protein
MIASPLAGPGLAAWLGEEEEEEDADVTAVAGRVGDPSPASIRAVALRVTSLGRGCHGSSCA